MSVRVSCELSGGCLSDRLITRPEESCRAWCVCVCVCVCDREAPIIMRPCTLGAVVP